MLTTFRVNDEYDDGWREVKAHTLHQAAELYVAVHHPYDPDLADGGLIRVVVKRPDDVEFEFVVQIDYEPIYTAKLIHPEPTP